MQFSENQPQVKKSSRKKFSDHKKIIHIVYVLNIYILCMDYAFVSIEFLWKGIKNEKPML